MTLIRKNAFYLFITCFFLNPFLTSLTTTTCYLNTFPYEYGGIIANTQFTAFDFNAPSGNLAVGGSSSDTTIVGSATLYPIILVYSKTGSMTWAKRYNTVSGGTKNAVSAVKYSPTLTTIAIVMAGTGISIVTLDAATGSTITQYHTDTSGGAYSVSAPGLYLTSSTNYVIAGTRDSTWALMLLKVGSGGGVNGVYEVTSTTFGKGYVLITGESTTAFYIGGFMQVTTSNSNKFTSVTRMTSTATYTSMTFVWNYVISQGTGSTYYYVSQMSLSTSYTTLYTAAQTGAAASQIIFSMFSLSGTYTVSSSTSYSTNDATNTNFCTAILGSSTTIYAFVYNSINYYLYFYIVNMSAFTYTKTEMQTYSGDSSAMMNFGQIFSYKEAYYAGYSKKIYTFTPTVTFTYEVGFVMAYDAHQSCATVSDTAGSTISMISETTFTSSPITLTASTMMLDSSTAPTVTTLGTANDGSTYTCTINPYIEVNAPTLSSSSYSYIVDSTALVISFTAATADYLCASTFTYTVVDAVTSDSYSFITVSSSGLTITVSSTSNSDAGTYSLVLIASVTGTTGTTYSGSVDFTLTIISPCTYATLTAPASIGPYTYQITNAAQSDIIPAFTSNASTCSISYYLYLYNLQAFDASLISYTPGTNTMTVSSSDYSKVGTYTMQIQALITGFTATATSTFTLYVTSICSTATISASTISPFSYYVSDASSVQTLTPFTISPSSCSITYSLTYDSTLVTFVATTPSISIYTTSTSKIGSYSLTLTGTVTGYTATASTTFTINVYSACAKSTITITASSPTTQTYYVTQSTLIYSIPAFTVSNSACSITYTLTLSNSGSIDTNLITFTASGPSISVYTTSSSYIGSSYDLMITGTLTGYSLSTSATFYLNVDNICSIATISPSSPVSQTYYVTDSTLFYTIPSFTSSNSACSITYTLTLSNSEPIDTNLITFTASGPSISVQTSEVSYIGSSYDLMITGTLTGQSITSSATFYLYVDNLCAIATISTVTPSSISYYVGDSALYTLFEDYTPSDLSCGITYTLTLSNSSPIDTILITFNPSDPSITVQSSNSLKIGTYDLMLTGTITGYTTSSSTTFYLYVYSLCSIATISPSSPVAQIYYVTDSALSYTIPSFTSSDTSCSITYTLTLSDSSAIDTSLITFTSSGPSISVYTTSSSYIGNSYDLMITGTLTGFSTITTYATFYLNIYNPCSIATISASTPVSQTYYVTNSALVYTIPSFTASNSNCGITYTLTLSDSSAIDTNLITFTPSGPSISVTTSNPSYIGTSYNLMITGTLSGFSISTSTTFYLYVDSLCSIATISPSTPVDQTYYATNSALYYAIPSFTSSDSSCEIIYTLSLSDSSTIDTSLITFTPSVPSISVSASDDSYDGTYDLMITGTFTGYSTITSSATFYLYVDNLCAIATISTVTPSSISYYVGDSALYTLFEDYTPSDTSCGITYTLTLSDSSPIDTTLITFNPSDPSITVQSSNSIQIGTYNLMLTGTITGETTSSSTTFYLYVYSLCSIATISPSSPVTQTYYVTYSALSYTIPSFTSSDSSCSITYTLTLSDSSAIDTSLITFTASGPSISVETSDASYIGNSYDLMITGTLTGFSTITTSATFYLNIYSPCSIATIVASTPVSQAYYVTDSALLYEIPSFTTSDSNCGITYTLTLSDSTAIDTNLITFTASDPSISVSTSDPSYIGTGYDLMVTGTLTGFSISTSTTFYLYVYSLCSIATITPSTPADQTYYATDSALYYAIPTFTSSDSSCGITYTLTLSDSSAIDTSLITFTPSDPSISVSASDDSQDGTYDLMITGTLTGFNTITSSATFYLYVYSLCSFSTITAVTQSSLTYYVGDSALYASLLSFTSSDSSCGITYTLTLSDSSAIDPNLITFTPTGPSIFVSTSNGGYVGTYELMLTGTLTGTPITTFTIFTLYVDSLCSIATITPSSPADQTYYVTDTVLSYTIPAFTVSDTSCSITYTLTLSDSSPIDTNLITFTPSQPSIQVQTTNFIYVDTYDLMITGTLTGFNSITSSATFYLYVYSICTIATITASTPSDQYYYVTVSALSYTIPVFTTSSSACSITYTLSLSDSSPYDSTLITFTSSPASISVQTSTSSYIGTTYNLMITGTITGQSTQTSATFYLYVYSVCAEPSFTITPSTIASQTYQVSATTLTYIIPIFTASDISCPITYSLTLANSSPYDSSIITFNPSVPSISVYTTKSNSAGLYNLMLTGTVSVIGSTTTSSATFNLNIISSTTTYPCLLATVTASTPPDTQYYIIGNDAIYIPLSYFSGSADYNQCGALSYQVTLTNGSSLNSSIFTFSNDTLALKVYCLNAVQANYNISLTGYYLNYPTVNASFTFIVEVMNKNRYSISPNPTQASASSSSFSPGQQNYSWTYNDTFKNTTNSSINVEESILEQLLKVQAQNSSTQTNPNLSALTAYISSVSMNGIASITFSELIVIPQNYLNIDSSVLNVSFFPSSEQTNNITLLSWNISSFTDQIMAINLYFSEPLLVSQNIVSFPTIQCLQIKDQIRVVFLSNGDFRSMITNQPIAYLYTITAYIPLQLSQSEYSLLSTIGSWILVGGVSIAGGAFTLSFALQILFLFILVNRDAGLSQLWALINYLQLIILLPTINLVFPANTQYFFSLFTQIATFQFYNFGPLIASVTNTNSSVLSDAPQFIQPLGINSTNIYINQATTIIVIFAFALGIIFAKILQRIKHKKTHLQSPKKQSLMIKLIHKVIDSFYGRMVYGGILRYQIEGYLFFAICTLLPCTNMSTTSGSAIAGVVLTIICIAFTVLFPLMVFLFLKSYREHHKNKEFKQKYVSLYEDVNSQNIGFYYIPIFLLRRLMLSATLIFSYNYSGIQVMVFIQQSILYLSFIYHFRVYIEHKMLRNEVLNEIILISAIYLCINFTDFMVNAAIKRIIGGTVIALMVLSIMMNLSLLMLEYLHALKVAFKKLYYLIRRKMRRNRVSPTIRIHSADTQSSPRRFNKYSNGQLKTFMNISPCTPLDLSQPRRFADDSEVPINDLVVEDFGFENLQTLRQLMNNRRKLSTENTRY